MSARILSAAELEERLAVWDAIADLFLDTEIQDGHREAIARTLAESRFSVDELRDIYLYEVAPVVHRNLKIVAGEWAGFGREWLAERIPAHLARGGLYRWWSATRPGRRWHTFQTRAHWQIVIRHVAAIRAGG